MQGKTAERWRELCKQAAEEQDPVKLLELVGEINDLLSRKQARLENQQAESAQDSNGAFNK
jgi:hypothetical protein